ncbi:astacin-like metalloendopeptidase [Bombina bombina]|uniref:astacin-like metalloendopeptidase n=1 Tax=Bombina bombina TaxID=8345 RepID=UPI00235A4978|nr:astacin-like metalloendopeptidase [Bombina bombina]
MTQNLQSHVTKEKFKIQQMIRCKDKETIQHQEPEDIVGMILKINQGSLEPQYEGDVMTETSRNGISCDLCLWPTNSAGNVIVPYTLSPNYTANDIAVIFKAMTEFETLTCVRFVPHSDQENYLNITSDGGCWSAIGMVGGGQVLSLIPHKCMSKGIIQHELNHALGFYHEHLRSDRDKYVTIVTNNIAPENLKHFEKIETNNLGTQYDFKSVMHYPRDAYSKTPGQATIVPKSKLHTSVGQRFGLSRLDVEKIKRLYNCDTCSFLHADLEGSIQSMNYPSHYSNNVNCVWLIRTPYNKVILTFKHFDVQYSENCEADYIKVYDGASKDSPVLLDKTCVMQLPYELTASTNMMLLEFVTDGSNTASGFMANYSSVQCGGAFYQHSGTFKSPGFPKAYLPQLKCLWKIIAPEGYLIKLEISSFELEYYKYCRHDYVAIFDGEDTTSRHLAKYCGTPKIPVEISSGNKLLVMMRTDYSGELSGFQASYEFCKYYKMVKATFILCML